VGFGLGHFCCIGFVGLFGCVWICHVPSFEGKRGAMFLLLLNEINIVKFRCSPKENRIYNC